MDDNLRKCQPLNNLFKIKDKKALILKKMENAKKEYRDHVKFWSKYKDKESKDKLQRFKRTYKNKMTEFSRMLNTLEHRCFFCGTTKNLKMGVLCERCEKERKGDIFRFAFDSKDLMR